MDKLSSIKSRRRTPVKRVDSKEKSTNLELRSRYELLLREEARLDNEIKELREAGVDTDVRAQMEVLHEYNEMKDLAQTVLGYLADAELVTIAELHRRLELPMDNWIEVDWPVDGNRSIRIIMSDTSEDTLQSDRQTDNEDGTCRDFVRGLCDRKFCKYKHESDVKPLNFCHDFQNNICPRQNCKFIHCTPEEVEEFKRTGQMSNQILAEATRKNQLHGNVPICNQFKKGMCRRNFCKYRHLTKEQEEAEILELIRNNNQGKSPVLLNNNINSVNNYNGVGGNGMGESQIISLGTLSNVLRRSGISLDEFADDGLPLVKRRLLTTPEHEILTCDMDSSRPRPVFRGYIAGNPPSPMLSRIDARTIMLEEENNLLHKEIAQLKRQVSDLTATNEFLLDQNANLRVSGKRNGTIPATVTITAASQQQPQPRQVIASVATVPVSLATVSTCNPVSGGHSVSIAAGMPAVSIAPPQAQLLASSQQILVTTNPSTQLAIANSNQAQLAIAQQNLANNLAQQAAQPQLTSQAQQLALATTTQQLTSQAQHMANQQMALASHTAPQQQLSQSQQLAMANPSQQLAAPQQLTHQQLTLAGTNQQLIAAGTAQQQLEMHRGNQMNAISTSQAIAMSNASQPMVSYPIMTQQSINHAMTH